MIINTTTDIINQVNVNFCDENILINNMVPNQTSVVKYINCSDDHYKIKIFFTPKQIIQTNLGYITSGNSFSDIIEIYDSNVVFKTNIK